MPGLGVLLERRWAVGGRWSMGCLLLKVMDCVLFVCSAGGVRGRDGIP